MIFSLAGTPSASSEQAKPSSSDKGISKGATAGIVIGVVVGVALLFLGIMFFAGRYIMSKRRAGTGFSGMDKEIPPGRGKLSET